MRFKTLVHVVLLIHVVSVSAVVTDRTEQTARMIMNTLKNLEEANEFAPVASVSQNPQTSFPPDVNDYTKYAQPDLANIMYDEVPLYDANVADIKSKRGWEDVSFIWRKSPKRAWEVVNRLWQNPEIRSKYKTYIANGKRSDEIVENIPVQQNNRDPFWMIDELGYDINFDDPVVGDSAEGSDPGQLKSSKRGWEAVIPAIWQRRVTSKRANIADIVKKGWEELHWKRDTNGNTINSLPVNDAYDDQGNFGPNYLGALDENGNKLRQFPPPNSYLMPPDYINARKDSRFDQQVNSNKGYIYDENDRFSEVTNEDSFPYNFETFDEDHAEKPENEWSKNEMLKRSAFKNLCRMLFGNVTMCTNRI